jgi:hypothetical protein
LVVFLPHCFLQIGRSAHERAPSALILLIVGGRIKHRLC